MLSRHHSGGLICRKPGRHNAGSTLMIVFWAILLLSAAIIAWAQWIYRDLAIHADANHALEARAMAHSGITMALNPMVNKTTPELRHDFAADLGYEVRMISEGGKLNVNWLLQGEDPTKVAIFKHWLEQKGLKQQERDILTDCLLDWIDADNLAHLNGVEDRGTYHAANRPLLSVDEIAQVWGSAPLTHLPNWKDELTIYSNGPIDLTAASAEVLRLIPGLSEGGIQLLLKKRQGPDGVEGTQDDYVFQSQEEVMFYLGVTSPQQQQALTALTTFNDKTMHITCVGHSGKVSRQLEIVARKGGGTNSPILFWKE